MRTEKKNGLQFYLLHREQKPVLQVRAGKGYFKNSGHVPVLGLEVIFLFSFSVLYYYDNLHAIKMTNYKDKIQERTHLFNSRAHSCHSRAQ